jgi:hypothetical protein
VAQPSAAKAMSKAGESAHGKLDDPLAKIAAGVAKNPFASATVFIVVVVASIISGGTLANQPNLAIPSIFGIAVVGLVIVGWLGTRPSKTGSGNGAGTSEGTVHVEASGPSSSATGSVTAPFGQAVGIVQVGEGGTANFYSAPGSSDAIRSSFAARLEIDYACTLNAADSLGFSLKQRGTMRDFLAEVAAKGSAVLGVDPIRVRANMFGTDGHGRMKIITDFMFNMNRPVEWTISMPVGRGSTGRCFAENSGAAAAAGHVARYDQGWGPDDLEPEELRKAHPDLRWIVSYPIYAPGAANQCLWVLNIDGLIDIPESQKLDLLVEQLKAWTSTVTYMLGMCAATGSAAQ